MPLVLKIVIHDLLVKSYCLKFGFLARNTQIFKFGSGAKEWEWGGWI